jgi:hypothetical protein
MTQTQEKVRDIIKSRDRQHPITGTQIAMAINLAPRKNGFEGADMRSIINALRKQGYPICADGNGYWWPRQVKELEEYIERFESRVADEQKSIDGLRRKLGELRNAPAIDPNPQITKQDRLV